MSDQQEHSENSPTEIDGARIISYNFNEDERPGGMRVRAKIRIVKGRQAETINRAQAEVIKELLLWARQQRSQEQERE